MSLILGFLIGVLAALSLFGLLVYWLCSQPNMALAKFIDGIAQALAHKTPKTERGTSDESPDATQDALLTRDGK